MDLQICVWTQTLGQVQEKIPFTIHICGGETISPKFSQTISLLYSRNDDDPFVTINLQDYVTQYG